MSLCTVGLFVIFAGLATLAMRAVTHSLIVWGLTFGAALVGAYLLGRATETADDVLRRGRLAP